MIRDVFYYGEKPNIHPREKFAKDLADARSQSTTEHFWIINEFCDYREFDWDFDFEFLADSDVWAIDHNNVWPSVYQKDSGTWLCPKKASDIILYRNDVVPLIRKNEKNKNWVLLDKIDESKFNFGWHPDLHDPPYIYKWGCKFFPVEVKAVLEYRVDGATQVKYMNDDVELLPQWDLWNIIHEVERTTFDFTWRPDPREPNFIYVFGNHLYDGTIMPTIEYKMHNATTIKYTDVYKPKLKSNKNLFKFFENSELLDYSWRPDPTSPPYIYVWGNQWNKPEDKISVQYTVPGATEYKYMTERAFRKPCYDNWITPGNINNTNFDYSWEPSPADPPFIYQFGTQWQKTGGPKYIVPNATQVKYIDCLKAQRLASLENWVISENITIENFDFSWHPDETDEPYIYRFGTKFVSAEEMYVLEYKVENAEKVKYVDYPKVRLKPDFNKWKIPKNIDVSDFDFSWIPDPKDPPYIYQFGTQHQKTGGPQYVAENATDIKYIDGLKARALPNKENWIIPKNLNFAEFDFSWHPDSTEPPYIYQYSTQWQKNNGPKYVVPGATDIKFVDNIIAKVTNNFDNWEIPNDIDRNLFDFSWYPNFDEEPYIYQFGTQWQKTGGPKYIVPNATQIKYVDRDILVAKKLENKKYYNIPEGIDVSTFDFSWHPDDTAPPYIYQFGTITDNTDGPQYIVPGNNGEIIYLPRIKKEIVESQIIAIEKYVIETTLKDLVQQHPNEVFWALNKNIDYSTFNFDWRPEIIHVAWESEYVHVFGSPQSETTHTYFVNAKSYLRGKTDLKFIEDQDLNENYLAKLFIKPNMFFVDKGNKQSLYRFEQLQLKYGNRIQKTRYLNSWVETINRCCKKSTTELFFVLDSELDYSDFEFDFYPNPWQMKMVHVFGTQWSHWGTTFLVNKESFPIDTKYIKIIEHLSNLNFVKNKKVKTTNCIYDIVLIDHGNKQLIEVKDYLQNNVISNDILVINYQNSYLETFKNLLATLPNRKEHYIWICSSICDYRNFDFSYVIDPFAKDQLHVFPSNNQKFGDTFFVDVNKMRDLIFDIELLENYNKVNYNFTLKPARYPAPLIVVDNDTHVSAEKCLDDFPYTIFVTQDNSELQILDNEPISLWQNESKNILVTSTGASRIIVPKEVNNYVLTQLYDYPYIKTASKLTNSKPLDIIFLSNGEKQADENYEHLLNVTKNIKNKVTRVDGVQGRVQAYHAVANASTTPWAFTVFAKLKINDDFDWSWQPDRLQVPKHYIFHAENPVNKLVYGHQAMIAYNKKLVLKNQGFGLDFTLDDPHEVVELLSGTAYYNTDEYSTWRTSFREVLKLRHSNSEVSKKRLEIWLNKAEGNFAEYSILGAKDAIEFYEKVRGDFNKIKLSFEWVWLEYYFKLRYF